MNNPEIIVKNAPFKHFCMSIGAIPTSYKDSLDYYETLLYLIKYLEETVIPVVNNNGEAVSELQRLYIELKNFVENYFANLDVQEEINNKLDEMADDGTLQEIIAEYLNSKAIFGFDNVDSMKSATNLINGSYAKTLGYYTKNDGGSALYKIRTITNDDVVDNAFIISLNDNTLIGELIIDNEINVKQIGCKGDNITDDSDILRNMFNVCRTKNITNIYFPKGIYKITKTLLEYGIDGLVIRGENDDIYNSTILMRSNDVTIFNFGGVMSLSGITYQARDLILENLTFRDSEDTYINNVFATLYYTQHFTIQNCTISNRNKSLDLKHCYDSRFINTDFTAGGNSNDAMITLHGGKHASPTEIGWDSANCITFECCRFERYFGTAIKTIKETQPAQYNETYDPAVAINVNTLWFDMCRFEAPTLLSGKHLDFNSTTSLRLNIQMTILDGQPGLKPINFDNCLGVFGDISVSYNQSTVGGATFSDFEEPIINILNNSGRFNLNLIVNTIYNHYLLDYFVNLDIGNNTRRTINMNLIYNGLSKKLFNDDSTTQNFNIYKQGRQINYGKYENGFANKVDNTVYNQYFNNMSYDSVNSRYSMVYKYTTSGNSNRTLDEVISNDDFSYHRFDSPIVANSPFMITPDKYPSSVLNAFRSSGTNTRAIMYGSTYPTSEQTNILFKAGDIIFNTTPTAGGNIGWVCTTSGNPGTWKAFGSIEN